MKRFSIMLVLLLSCAVLLHAEAASSRYADMDLNAIKSIKSPEDLTGRFSYIYGYALISSAMAAYPDLDLGFLVKGMFDALEGGSLFTSEETLQILNDYQMRFIEESIARQRKLASENLEKAVSFLKANLDNPKVKVTSSGLQYEVIREGSGAMPGKDSNVRVNYQCSLLSGEIIDSSYQRKVPSDFNLGSVIKGFSEGIQLMKVGAKYRFWVPPDIGYGAESTDVEPNSLLIFEVELLGINK